ncbi:MAG: hypothetical protein VYA34_01025 [Myxococcota bacterium]|nr:hypothetical protein [Myxococcota bacterium]
MEKPTILIVCHDPGGANVLAPLLKPLAIWANISIHASPMALGILQAFSGKGSTLAANMDEAQAQTILTAHQPSMLLTATSWGTHCETIFRNVAADLGLPSVVVIDFWSNYGLRFAGAKCPLQELPDTICVMDSDCQQAMVAHGFCAENLRVTGQPFLDHLFQKAQKKKPQSTPTAKPTGLLLLSQPNLTTHTSILGETLIPTLARVSQDFFGAEAKPTLHVKPHPKESPTELQKQLANHGLTPKDVPILDAQRPLPSLLPRFSHLIGPCTTGLFEARAAGLQVGVLTTGNEAPGLKKAITHAGIICLPDQSPKAILDFLKHKPSAQMGGPQNAIANVLEVIGEILASN